MNSSVYDSLRAKVTCEKYEGPPILGYDHDSGISRKADFRCVARGDGMIVEGYVQSPSNEEMVTGELNPRCNSEDLSKVVNKDTYVVIPKRGTDHKMREIGLRPRDGHLVRTNIRRR